MSSIPERPERYGASVRRGMRVASLREASVTKAPSGSGVGAVEPLEAVAAADEDGALGCGPRVEALRGVY
jgi:hypothetical protein